jgi:hypothetical protein
MQHQGRGEPPDSAADDDHLHGRSLTLRCFKWRMASSATGFLRRAMRSCNPPL